LAADPLAEVLAGSVKQGEVGNPSKIGGLAAKLSTDVG
jgi:hypothetical protein